MTNYLIDIYYEELIDSNLKDPFYVHCVKKDGLLFEDKSMEVFEKFLQENCIEYTCLHRHDNFYVYKFETKKDYSI